MRATSLKLIPALAGLLCLPGLALPVAPALGALRPLPTVPCLWQKACGDESLADLSDDISNRRLIEDEFTSLSDWDLTVLRNVPYARHGYRFSNSKLLNYFSNKSWYRPNTSSQSVAERRLSRLESRNVTLIMNYQKGYRNHPDPGYRPETSLADVMYAMSERRVTGSDLAGKTAWQLTIIRNTPYARHGYRFSSAKLRSYFNGKSWYAPNTGDPVVAERRFSSVESRNAKFVLDYQNAHGMRDAP